jgi:hypothetical protein
MKAINLLTLATSFALSAILVAPSSAEICQFGTGNTAVSPYPTLTQPAYRSSVSAPPYGGSVTRIANDSSAACGTGCVWQANTRHHYSKDQPWSADGAVLALQNKLGTPKRIYLDGSTYGVLNYTDHTNPQLHYSDWRWHPLFPYVQIVMDADANTVYWIDVRYPGDLPIKTCYFGDSLRISPNQPEDAIGQFEGNATADGNLLAITKVGVDSVFILNMSSGARGRLVRLPAANLLNHPGTLGWTSISPDGHFLVAKYADGPGTQNDELIRVFDVDPITLAINADAGGVAIPHQYQVGQGASVPCGLDNAGIHLSPANGWVHPLKHADMMLAAGAPILVGVNGCSSSITGYASQVGRILRVDLTSGKVTTLSSKDNNCVTPPCYAKEAPASHVSCRNLARPGWAYVTYDYATTVPNDKRFSGEIVAVSIDSSGVVERFAFTHTDTKDSTVIVGGDTLTIPCGGGHDCEAQAVPDLYGARIVWASNWQRDCGTGGCGVWSQPKDYLLDAHCVTGGCPFVDTWTNSGWQVENSILGRSLTNALSLDAYRLKATPQVVDGKYRLEIRENEREITTIDQVRLAYVDHAADMRAYAMGDRVLLGTRAPAYRVTTAAGIDITELVGGSGLGYFVGEPGETLTVALVKPGSTPPAATMGSGGGDLDPFEIDPGDKEGGGGAGTPALFGATSSLPLSEAAVLNSTGILVQGQDASGVWTTVRKTYPRKEFDQVLVDTLDQGPVRLVFVGRHKLSYVGRVIPIGGASSLRVLGLLSARHSRLGDVRAAVVTSGDVTTSLTPGDTLALEFAAAPIAEGQVRDFFLLSRGVYQSAALISEQSPVAAKPQHFALLQNRPNPFPARTAIRFELPVGSMVRIDILDAQGRRLQTLADHFFPAGYQTVEWNPREASGTVGPGVYFCQIQSGPFRDRKQMVLLP